MIEVENRIDAEEARLAAADEKGADEFLALLRSLSEEERERGIKEVYLRLTESARLCVKANQTITSYQLALLTLAHRDGDLVIRDDDIRDTEGALEQRYDQTLEATIYRCAPISPEHRAEILAEYEAEKSKDESKPS
jgi:hypothetical protein